MRCPVSKATSTVRFLLLSSTQLSLLKNRPRAPRSPRRTRYSRCVSFHQFPKFPQFPAAAAAFAFLHSFVRSADAIFLGGEQGVLAGYDQKSNVVLSDSKERVYSIDEGIEEVPLGLYLVKGDMMCVLFRPVPIFLPPPSELFLLKNCHRYLTQFLSCPRVSPTC